MPSVFSNIIDEKF